MTYVAPRRRQFLGVLGGSALAAVAGCLGSGDGDTAEPGAPPPTDWRAATLEDATSGEQFRIEAFEHPALVHTFAANCLTCASQQDEFVRLWGRRDDIEIVELSVDPNDLPADIASHAERSGLAWRVGVAPESVTRSLIAEFGREVSVSAQSPIIIVCPDGTTNTVSKIADPDELERAIEDTC